MVSSGRSQDTAKHATMPRTAPTSPPVSTAEVEKRGYNPKELFLCPGAQAEEEQQS